MLGLNNENNWSDVLGTFVSTDPAPLLGLVGLEQRERVRVRREVRPSRDVERGLRDRLDLLVCGSEGESLVAIEAKVLAPLGPRQLERYTEAFPADKRVLVIPGAIGSDVLGGDWDTVSWEQILDAYASSRVNWVAETALLWRAYLSRSFPRVGAQTVWGTIDNSTAESSQQDVVVGMKARMAWLLAHQSFPTGVTGDLVGSSAGRSPVMRVYSRESDPQGRKPLCEVEELSRLRGKDMSAEGLKGPRILVGLLMSGQSSKWFDWEYLAGVFWPFVTDQVPSAAPWIHTSCARPRDPVDRTAHAAMVSRHPGLAYLGFGYGNAQAKAKGEFLFGAEIRLPNSVTLEEVNELLNHLAQAISAFSRATRG